MMFINILKTFQMEMRFTTFTRTSYKNKEELTFIKIEIVSRIINHREFDDESTKYLPSHIYIYITL